MLVTSIASGIAVSRKLSLIVLQSLGAVLGQLMCVCRSCRYFYSTVNLRLCFPEYSDTQIRTLARQSMREMGKTFFEVMLAMVWPGFFKGTVRRVYGEEHLLRAREQGKSIILTGPHLGNWEVLNVYAGQFAPCASYKPASSQWLDRYLRRCRETPGTKLVSIHTDGLKAMCAVLKKGGMIMMFPDQLPSEESGRSMAPFFNIPVWTGTLVSRLAQRENTVVLCGFARRLPMGAGFDIYLEPVPEAVYSEKMPQSVAALNEGIENCIRHCIQQYVW